MTVYDLSQEQMAFLEGMAAERRKVIMARGATSVGTPRRDTDDVLGLMGEYATLIHLKLPIYQWHALWSRDLPDVGTWEIRTRRREGDPMGVNESKLRSVDPRQKFMLCYASIEYATVRLVGWATASDVRQRGELVTTSDGSRYYRLDASLTLPPPRRAES
jgi:hypothetical protein